MKQLGIRINKYLLAAVTAGSLLLGAVSAAHAEDAAKPAVVEAKAAPADATPVPPPMPPKKTVEEVDNPYGLGALWAQGDFVAKGTLMILIIMSMGSWYILVTKLLEQRRLFSHAVEARRDFWASKTVADGVNALADGGAFRFVAENAVQARQEFSGELATRVGLNTWVEMAFNRSFEEIQARLQIGMAFLGTVGSTAPFIGLFGTVWGIYHALTAIGIAGQASIDKVAGPVGESLLMTAIGLAVAVPAVLGYNWLVRRNKVTMDSVRGFAADVHGVLMGAKQVR